MNKTKAWTVIKSVIVIGLWITYFLLNKLLPIVSNNIALAQMSNSNESYLLWQLYQSVVPNLPLILTLLTVLAFRKEIMIKNKK